MSSPSSSQPANFSLIDVATGDVVIDQKLEPPAISKAFKHCDPATSCSCSSAARCNTQFKPIGQPVDFPIVNGPVYAFSLKTGEPLWPGRRSSATAASCCRSPTIFRFLVFADRQTIRDATNGGGTQLRVLCLDKRTGQTVYRNEALPDTSATRFRVRGETDRAHRWPSK